MKPFLIVVFLVFLPGCLTYKDIYAEQEQYRKKKVEKELFKDQDMLETDEKEEGKIQKRKDSIFLLSNEVAQTNGASVMEKMAQMETSLRELRGEMETINKAREEQVTQTEKGLLSLIQTLSLRMDTLTQEIKSNKQKDLKHKKKDDPKVFFEKAEKLFQEQKWKEASTNYQKYREQSKKGKLYKKSTLQIGLCFYNLGMYREAKVFFRELLEFFPKSPEAKSAQNILSQRD